MSLHFYAYARKGYEFVDDVASALHTTDSDRAGRITKCIFRALRNRISTEHSLKLVQHLPMALKAVYIDGWNPVNVMDPSNHRSDFISEVVKEDARSAWRDFATQDDVRQAILALFAILEKHIGTNEMEQLARLLPRDLYEMLAVEKTGKTR